MPVDYSEYHPKWSLIGLLIRKRAGYKCERCGAQEGEIHPDTLEVITYYDLFTGELVTRRTGVIVMLGVAHLDHNINHNRFSNLAAMCRRCHLNHDRIDNQERRKYGKKAKNEQQKQLF